MTLEEAIKYATSRSTNINLQYFISEWNDGYIIHSTSHMKRHPDTPFVYCTGDPNKQWYVVYDEKAKAFKHIVKKVKKSDRLKIKKSKL